MIAKRPSRARMRPVKFDEPPTPPPPAPVPIPPAPTVASGATKIPSYPLIVVAVMLLAAVTLGLMQFVKRGSTAPSVAQQANAQEQTFNPDDIASLVAHVATRISVNMDETPSVAIVQDADVLRMQNPDFYKEVEAGDRLLIWPNKAVLYSVRRDLILNTVTVPVVSTPVAPAAASVTENVGTVEVRNGSGVAGLGKTIVKQLSAAGVQTLPAIDAKVKGYEQTIIAVPEGKTYSTTIQQLQEILGVSSVTVIPAAETGVNGDILVVVGLDKKP